MIRLCETRNRRSACGGPKEIVVVLIVLAIVLLVFGPKRIKSLGSELGNAIRGFRQAVRDKDAQAQAEAGMESVAHEETAQATTEGADRSANARQNV